jgi:hypothetical protein
VVNDRFLPRRSAEPVPADPRPASAAAARRPAGLTVISGLSQLQRRHQITAAAHRRYLSQFRSALRVERRLRGTRAAELEAVIANLHEIAAGHALTASRLPALFLTLERNVQWWTQGPLLSYGQRVEFKGSQLVWEYYPGQGIELQVLGSFGKADGLFTAGPGHTGQLRALLGELIPLAARRAGGLAWEYYFHFDGGRPPWVSAMAQGTGLEALTRAFRATGDSTYLTIAHRALPLFTHGPPSGVAVPLRAGTRYLQYSFAPHTDILNAFLQTLIGLFDYSQVSGDPEAQDLFAAGDAQARLEVPRFDTGAWSLYQPGLEDSLSYHQLVTGFLAQLCTRTQATVYCRTAQHFHAYEHTPPKLSQLTFKAMAKRPVILRFRLSKISRVGIVVLRAGHTVAATSAQFSHGVHAFAVPALRRGTYSVHLAATDLAGNFHRIVGSLTVRPRHR